jgi:hypothetical protein
MSKANTRDILLRVTFKVDLLKEAASSGMKKRKEETEGRRAFLRRICRLRKLMRN